MSELRPNDADASLRVSLCEALAARDQQLPAGTFHRMWPARRGEGTHAANGDRDRNGTWGIGFRVATAFAVAAVVAVGLWASRTAWLPGSGAGPSHAALLDSSVATQLSSSDYWRVPSDQLLALSSPPLAAPLPDATGFDVSLEESVL